MRARKKKRSLWEEFIDSAGPRFPAQRSLEGMLSPDPSIAAEIAAKRAAIEGAAAWREKYEATRPEKRAGLPLIAGYTDNPAGAEQGFARWLGKTPSERFWDSALGAAYQMSSQYGPEERLRPWEYAEKIASQAEHGNYWGGVAGNIMYGREMPSAKLWKQNADINNFPSDVPVEAAFSPRETQQTQSPEGIARSAMQNKALQDAAREIEDLRRTNPEAAAQAEQGFFNYFRKTYGLNDETVVSRIYNLLRGRP